MKFLLRIFLVVLVIVLSNHLIIAGGTDFIPVFGARSIALNGLYIVGNNSISSSYFNPATLALTTGRGIELTVINRLEQQSFDSKYDGLHNSFRDNNTAGAGGIFWKISNDVAFGLSYNRVTDFRVNWPFVIVKRTPVTSSIAAFDMSNTIQVDAISPALSYSMGSTTLGVSLHAYDVRLASAFPLGNPLWYSKNKGSAAYQVTTEQSAWSYGFTLGAMSAFSEGMRIGGFVKSGFKANLNGNAQSSMIENLDSVSNASEVNLTSTYEHPWTFGLGIIYNIRPNLILNVDAVMGLWGSTQKNMALSYENTLWQKRLSGVDSLTGLDASNINLSYKNSIDIGFGLEYSSGSGFDYRVGYRYSISPNSEETFNMLLPAVDKHWLSIGFGYKGGALSFDVAIAYSFGPAKEILRSGKYYNLSGKYSSDNYIPTITLQYLL